MKFAAVLEQREHGWFRPIPTSPWILVAVFMVACIESNPQPSPQGNNAVDTLSAGDLWEGDKDGVASLTDATVQDDFSQQEDQVSFDAADISADSNIPLEDAVDVDDVDLTPEDVLEEIEIVPCVEEGCPAGPGWALDPSVNGPYPVGVRTHTVDLLDHLGNPRTIRVEVWYPTTDEYADGPFDAIDFYADAPEDLKSVVEQYREQLPSIQVDVTRDAPPRIADGPFPLVVFSHGAYGVRFQSVFFTVPLASHGYVVVSADHTGNVLYDLLLGAYNVEDMILSAFDRPLDAVALIDDAFLRNEDPDGYLFGMINESEVGISGHSFGGYTSLNLGFTDSRIKAVLPMAPATTPLGLLGFDAATFPVPMMMMAGAMDKTLPPDGEMREPYTKYPSPKFYFELNAGGHFTYSDICQLDLLYVANDLGIDDADNALKDGCAEYNVPSEVAHPLIRQFGIGFFNYYLRHSDESLPWFNANAASMFPEILTYLDDMIPN